MQRYLTEDEIEYVLQEIKPIKSIEQNISGNIYAKIKSTLEENIRGIMVYPDIIEDLKKKLTWQYYNSQVQAGESIGILTAQSIGSGQTQSALDSFHSTGITTVSVVTGVPRFNELVNTTKNPKNVLSTIYTSEEYKDIKDIRDNVGIFIKHLIFKDIVKSFTVYTNFNVKDFWYDSFNILYKKTSQITYKHCIRYECDIEIIFLYKLHIEDVVSKITSMYEDIQCIWSPTILGIIDVWFNDPEPLLIKDTASIYANEIIIPNLDNITISGIDGINNVQYTNKQGNWLIEASGFNLKKLFTSDLVDYTRTVSNNMWEIYNILGIEATREFLIQEFIKTISSDSYINLRHIQLLVDVMLYTGTISSISRYGVHKNQSGALTKCSFEESLDQILKAGIYGETENISGVSGAIICGKVSNVGTGLCDLIYSPEPVFSGDGN
jgi:DNA-directed RNA polymerase beta' subunit